jgi:hypothetical protein
MPTVKADICNLAASRCGQKGTVEDIDTPSKPIEKTFAKWWIQSLEMALKEMKPSFATIRRYLTVNAVSPSFGYGDQYAYPSDCVAFLGIGDIKDKTNNYTIEDGFIRTDAYSGEDGGLPVRMVILIEDVSKFSPEFIEELSWYLASNVNMEITQDVQKQIYLDAALDKRRPQCASVNSQENRPTRISVSKFKQARYNSFPQQSYKK